MNTDKVDMEEYSFSIFDYLELSIPLLFMLGFVVAIHITGRVRQAIDNEKMSVEEAQDFLDEMKPFTRSVILRFSFTSYEEIDKKPKSTGFFRALEALFQYGIILLLLGMSGDLYFNVPAEVTPEYILAVGLVIILIFIAVASLRFAYKTTSKLKR